MSIMLCPTEVERLFKLRQEFKAIHADVPAVPVAPKPPQEADKVACLINKLKN